MMNLNWIAEKQFIEFMFPLKENLAFIIKILGVLVLSSLLKLCPNLKASTTNMKILLRISKYLFREDVLHLKEL
jgi:hypothetical protein